MRDPLQRVPIRAKLTLMFVTICFLAFGVGGWIASTSAKSALEKEILQRLDIHSRVFATALDGALKTLAQRTQDFASDGYIRTRLAQILGDEAAPKGADPRGEMLRHLRENKLPLVPAFLDLVILAQTIKTVLHFRGM